MTNKSLWYLKFSCPCSYNAWFRVFLHHVVWWSDTRVSEVRAASIFRTEDAGSTVLNLQPWRWRQHRPPKRWFPTTTLHDV